MDLQPGKGQKQPHRSGKAKHKIIVKGHGYIIFQASRFSADQQCYYGNYRHGGTGTYINRNTDMLFV